MPAFTYEETLIPPKVMMEDKDKGSIAKWENLLRKAIKLQEGWDTFLEPSHYFTHQG